SSMANVADYAAEFGAYVVSASTWGVAVGALVLVGLMIAGVAAARRDAFVGVASVAALALIVVWPSSQDRLLLSTLPFAGLAACVAIAPWLARAPRAAARAVGYALIVVAGFVIVRQLDVRRE